MSDDFVAANKTTGGAKGESSSVVVIFEGIGGKLYMVGAQKDRFIVLAVAVDPDRALDLAAKTLEKL